VGGVPLVARVGTVVRDLPEIDRTIVSTDSSEIAKVAESAGIAAPFMRPADLSGDRIGDWDVLKHALLEAERIDGFRYDVILMLQPTCPLRLPRHVRDSFTKLIDEGWDSVWTVSETDSKGHPLKQLLISENGSLTFYDDVGRAIIARQQLKPVYHRNGAAYAFTRECLLEQESTYGKKPGVVVIADRLANIDTLEDLELANFVLEQSLKATRSP
jgi:CMP-N-acetylneuraminic acid synthetase